jgi:hypothetical protein
MVRRLVDWLRRRYNPTRKPIVSFGHVYSW